jgi:hypothetical protein
VTPGEFWVYYLSGFALTTLVSAVHNAFDPCAWPWEDTGLFPLCVLLAMLWPAVAPLALLTWVGGAIGKGLRSSHNKRAKRREQAERDAELVRREVEIEMRRLDEELARPAPARVGDPWVRAVSSAELASQRRMRA